MHLLHRGKENMKTDPTLKGWTTPALHSYIHARAVRIAEQTPMGPDEAWDDTEDWLVEAAELAHATLELMQREGRDARRELQLTIDEIDALGNTLCSMVTLYNQRKTERDESSAEAEYGDELRVLRRIIAAASAAMEKS